MVFPLDGVNLNGDMNSFGPATNVLYLSVQGYVILTIMTILTKFKSFSNKKYYPIYIFILLIILALYIRTFWPTFIFISFLYSLRKFIP